MEIGKSSYEEILMVKEAQQEVKSSSNNKNPPRRGGLGFLHLLSLHLFSIWREIDTLKISGDPLKVGPTNLWTPLIFNCIYLSSNGE
jgi:hypothetical protein